MATFNNNEKYQIYAGSLVKDVPLEYLKILITLFLDHAALNMGANIEKVSVDRIIEIVRDDYVSLPVNQIASAFIKGSMGYYGEGRLIPRTVYRWLAEINQYYMTIQNKKDESYYKTKRFMELDKYPLGQAICKKIDWLKPHAFDAKDWDVPGIITEEEYDRIDLRELAEMIGAGHRPIPQDFGIKPIKTE